MAIIIPSKSIYRQDNPKVRDNVIEKIEFSSKKIYSTNEYNTPVFNVDYGKEDIEKYGIFEGEELFDTAVGREDAGSVYTYGYGISYLQIRPDYFPKGKTPILIKIPKITNGNFIEKLQTGEKDGYKNIKVTVAYKQYFGTAKGNCVVSDKGKTTNVTVKSVGFDNDTTEHNGNTYILPMELTHKYTWESQYVQTQLYSQTADLSKKFKEYDLDNVGKIFYTEHQDYFNIGLKIHCGYERIAMGGYTPPKIGSQSNDVTVELNGTVEVFIPTGIYVTFNGNVFKLSIEDVVQDISKSENAKTSFLIDSNELNQTTNYYGNENDLLLPKQAENVLTSHQNGKETATLRCSIVDYYDENGNLAIGIYDETKPMCFQQYDKVIPMDYVVELLMLQERKKAGRFDFNDNVYIKGYSVGDAIESSVYAEIGVKSIKVTSDIAGYGVAFPIRASEFEQFTLNYTHNGNGEVTAYFYDKNNLSLSGYTNGVDVESGKPIMTPKGTAWIVYNFKSDYGKGEAIFDKPQVFSNKKHDVPMSRYKDGTPKQFQVLSTDIEYDGSVMQTIEIQEILQNEQTTVGRLYTVSFMIDNYEYAKVKTNADGTVKTPSDPIVSNRFTFKDWYTEPNGQGSPIDDFSVFDKDTKVYAYVTEDMDYTVNVTFHGTFDGETTIQTKEGGYLLSLPRAKQKNFYTFDGWYTLENGMGDKISTSYKFEADMDVYAHYIESRISDLLPEVYGVIENVNQDVLNVDKKAMQSNRIVASINDSLNSKIDKWDKTFVDIGGIHGEISELGDTIDKIGENKIPQIGKVYLNPNGGYIYINNQWQKPNEAGLVEAEINMYAPYTSGKLRGTIAVYKDDSDGYKYEHNGWSLSQENGSLIGIKGELENGKTYYAQYEKTEITHYNITIQTDYGTFADGTTIKTIEAKVGQATTINLAEYSLINVPSYAHHRGWSIGDTTYGIDEVLVCDEETFIYAVFEFATGVSGGEDGITVDVEALSDYVGAGMGEVQGIEGVLCEGTPDFIGTGQLENHGLGNKIPLIIVRLTGVIEAGAIDVNAWNVIFIECTPNFAYHPSGAVPSFFNRNLPANEKFTVTVQIYDEATGFKGERTYNCINIFPENVNK